MRRFVLVILAAAGLAPVGCGGSTTATTSGSPGDSPEYRQQMQKDRQKGGDTRGTAR
jgi:hypothetical protein